MNVMRCGKLSSGEVHNGQVTASPEKRLMKNAYNSNGFLRYFPFKSQVMGNAILIVFKGDDFYLAGIWFSVFPVIDKGFRNRPMISQALADFFQAFLRSCCTLQESRFPSHGVASSIARHLSKALVDPGNGLAGIC